MDCTKVDSLNLAANSPLHWTMPFQYRQNYTSPAKAELHKFSNPFLENKRSMWHSLVKHCTVINEFTYLWGHTWHEAILCVVSYIRSSHTKLRMSQYHKRVWPTVTVAVRPVSSASSLSAAASTSSPDSSRPEGGSNATLVCENEEANYIPYHAVMWLCIYCFIITQINQKTKQACEEKET